MIYIWLPVQRKFLRNDKALHLSVTYNDHRRLSVTNGNMALKLEFYQIVWHGKLRFGISPAKFFAGKGNSYALNSGLELFLGTKIVINTDLFNLTGNCHKCEVQFPVFLITRLL